MKDDGVLGESGGRMDTYRMELGGESQSIASCRLGRKMAAEASRSEVLRLRLPKRSDWLSEL